MVAVLQGVAAPPRPASPAFVAPPGLSAHSHLLPALGNLLRSPDFHWIHGEPFVLRCCPVWQHVCGAELPSPGSELVLPVPRVAPLPAQGGTPRAFCIAGGSVGAPGDGINSAVVQGQ